MLSTNLSASAVDTDIDSRLETSIETQIDLYILRLREKKAKRRRRIETSSLSEKRR